jgi:hypothetical protein
LRYLFFILEATLDNYILLAMLIAGLIGLVIGGVMCMAAIALLLRRQPEEPETPKPVPRVPVSTPPEWTGSDRVVTPRELDQRDKDPMGQARYMPRPNPAATTWEDIPTPPTAMMRDTGPDEEGFGSIELTSESPTTPPSPIRQAPKR